MLRKRKRRSRSSEPADLDVTPFMNLMIVLVPVLLLSMVFTHTTVIDLDFPAGNAEGEVDPATVHLEVQVHEDALVVADGRSVIRRLPVLAGGMHDYDGLGQVMKALKERLPAKREATILLAPATDYQTLVFVMDRVRSTRITENGEDMAAELFPVLSLGDTPPGDAGRSDS